MKNLITINIHNILAGNIENDSYKREIKFHNNCVYETYCIYNDDKIKCTVFKNHKRIIEVDIILDMLETNYIKVETKSLNINNQNEINYIAKNMIKPLVQKLVA